MTGKEKQELKDWIAKLKTVEGRTSFISTMGCTHEDVDYEISLAERVLQENEDYYEMMMARSSHK